MAWGILARVAAPFAKKAAKWVGRQALGAARATGAQTIGGAVARAGAGVAAAAGVARVAGGLTRPTLSLPQGFAPQGGFPMPRPQEGVVGRTISRILPGGMTGREYTPYGDLTDKYGRPIAVYPAEVVQVRGPRGYVVVNYNGEQVAIQSRVAQKMGLYTPPAKPPITAADMKAIRRANGARKRVQRTAKMVGLKGCKTGRC